MMQNLSQDVALSLLSHQRRRSLLAVLRYYDEPLTLSDVARAIAVREETAALSELDEAYVDKIEMDLHHRHLPKLAEHGMIEYDPEERTVALGNTLERESPPINLESDADTVNFDSFRIECQECREVSTIRLGESSALWQARDHHDKTHHSVKVSPMSNGPGWIIGEE